MNPGVLSNCIPHALLLEEWLWPGCFLLTNTICFWLQNRGLLSKMQSVAAITNAAHKHHLLRQIRRLGLSTCTYILLLSCQLNIVPSLLAVVVLLLAHCTSHNLPDHTIFMYNILTVPLFSIQIIVCDSACMHSCMQLTCSAMKPFSFIFHRSTQNPVTTSYQED